MKHPPFFAVALLTVLALPASAAAGEFGTVLAEKSAITFVSKQMGAPNEGRFGKFGARIVFDPAKPERCRAQVDVDLASIDAGSADATEEARGKAWFNTREFPVAQFVAGSFRALGNGRYEAAGKMTIKGSTRDVVAPFSAKIDGNVAVLEGGIPLRRLQYGIGDGVWADTSVIADEVQVRFRLALSTVPAAGK